MNAGIAGVDNVRKFLDLSTAHLPERFFEDGSCLTGRYQHDVGMLLWVPDDPTEHVREHGDDPQDCDDAAPEVLAVRLYARSLGCDYILFDADGPEDPNLPVFEW